MSWESVPWAVGGGAVVSPEVARLVAYMAANGNEGTLGPNDLKVAAMAVAGAGVDIAPGAAIVPCRTAGYAYQSYAGRNPTVDNVGVTATGAGSGRVDMVVARVEDPWLPTEPWADPVDVAVGPYIYTRVIQNVGAAAVASKSAARAFLAAFASSSIPLAGITLPVSTAAVLGSHITDLRNVAKPRTDRRPYILNPGAKVSLSSASYVDWAGSWSVEVPVWATQAAVFLNIYGARLDRQAAGTSGTSVGRVRIALGTATPGPVLGQGSAYDILAPGSDAVARHSLGAGDLIDIPAGYRGTVQTLHVQGIKSSGNQNVYVDATSSITVDIEFQETAV